MEDILLIDKPKGITSFDVIRKLRKELHGTKMGHAGTLDPLASGLLLVATGKNTKKLNHFLKLPKTYDVEILVGESRTTGDMEGEVIEKSEVDELSEKEVLGVFEGMIGTVSLQVPRYSAIKVGGEPLYKKARRGDEFEPPVKDMIITDIRLLGLKKEDDYYVVSASMDVGSGAYVRSIAEEVGRRLGYPAVVKELRRTVIGDFVIENARTLDI